VAFVDGLLFDRLVGSGALGAPTPGTPESRAELVQAVRAALRGVLGPRSQNDSRPSLWWTHVRIPGLLPLSSGQPSTPTRDA
jgi:hypothetical protein